MPSFASILRLFGACLLPLFAVGCATVPPNFFKDAELLSPITVRTGESLKVEPPAGSTAAIPHVFEFHLYARESVTLALRNPKPVKLALFKRLEAPAGQPWQRMWEAFPDGPDIEAGDMNLARSWLVADTGLYRVAVLHDSSGPDAPGYVIGFSASSAAMGFPAQLHTLTPEQAAELLDKPDRVVRVGEAAAPDDVRPATAILPPRLNSPLSPEGEAWVATRPEPLRPFYASLWAGGEHEAVLNLQRLGLAAIEAGEMSIAERAFDAALERIETVYVNDPAAAAARSKWSLEANKDFKGEPYERAMAYYYRGLLYLKAGDYENARAAFRSGEFQDTVSEAEEFQGDFALLTWLAGWCSRCLGDEAAATEDFALAAQILPTLQAPAKNHDRLFLAELGRGPVKVKRGGGRQLLTFAVSREADRELVPRLAEAGSPMIDAASISTQAMTRGSRPIDAILNGKAAFHEGARNVQATAGDIASQIAGATPVGGAVGLGVSLVSAAIGSKARTDTDIRQWDTLPDRIALSTAASAEVQSSKFDFGSAGLREPALAALHGRCGIAWARSRPALTAEPGVVGAEAEAISARQKNKVSATRDAAFRAELVEGTL